MFAGCSKGFLAINRAFSAFNEKLGFQKSLRKTINTVTVWLKIICEKVLLFWEIFFLPEINYQNYVTLCPL